MLQLRSFVYVSQNELLTDVLALPNDLFLPTPRIEIIVGDGRLAFSLPTAGAGGSRSLVLYLVGIFEHVRDCNTFCQAV